MYTRVLRKLEKRKESSVVKRWNVKFLLNVCIWNVGNSYCNYRRLVHVALGCDTSVAMRVYITTKLYIYVYNYIYICVLCVDASIMVGQSFLAGHSVEQVGSLTFRVFLPAGPLCNSVERRTYTCACV